MRVVLPIVVAAAALAVAAPSASASCAFLSSAEQEVRADVVVVGTILEAAPGPPAWRSSGGSRATRRTSS